MKLLVEISPHSKANYDIPYIMRQVIIALIPAITASIIIFKIRAVIVLASCIISAAVTEEVTLRIRKKPSAIKDSSAILTGILLALVLPPSLPWWAASLGAIFAVLVGKQLFGGLGQNIFNPALLGRAFLMAAYPVMLTSWTQPFTLSAVTSATPLSLWKFSHIITNTKSLFLGNVSGSLGETSAIAIIIGGLYLIIRKIADWRAPLGMFISIASISTIAYSLNPANASPLFHLFAGGAMLGMFFMVTDPVTTPVTKSGRLIFGLCVGALVMTIRFFAGLPEGVMYSILFFNAFVPLINKLTKPKSFGR